MRRSGFRIGGARVRKISNFSALLRGAKSQWIKLWARSAPLKLKIPAVCLVVICMLNLCVLLVPDSRFLKPILAMGSHTIDFSSCRNDMFSPNIFMGGGGGGDCPLPPAGS